MKDFLSKLAEGIENYRRNGDFREPTNIKMNPSLLNDLRKDCKYFTEAFDVARVPAQEHTILGLRIEIDHTLKDNEVIIYRDENIYLRLILKEKQ